MNGEPTLHEQQMNEGADFGDLWASSDQDWPLPWLRRRPGHG